MELIFTMFQMFLISYLVARNNDLCKKIDTLEKNQIILHKKLVGDIEGTERVLVHISKKLDFLTDTVKEDIHRSSLALRESLETAKPIKPNNWDSVKEAFKGPVRVEINERN